MKISLTRENLLKVLQTVGGVVEKRQTMPILGNVLFHVFQNTLTVTASDLEIETRAQTELESSDTEQFAITLPAIKLINIVRSLPDGLTIIWISKSRAARFLPDVRALSCRPCRRTISRPST